MDGAERAHLLAHCKRAPVVLLALTVPVPAITLVWRLALCCDHVGFDT